MSTHRITLLSIKAIFLYAAIHIILLGIILFKNSVIGSIVLIIFGILTLTGVISSKNLDVNKTLPLWKEIFIYGSFSVFGLLVIRLGMFINDLLPLGYYAAFRQQAYLYISLGAGLILISLSMLILIMLKQMIKK